MSEPPETLSIIQSLQVRVVVFGEFGRGTDGRMVVTGV